MKKKEARERKKKKTKKLLKVGLVVEKEIEKRFSPPSTQKRNGGKNTNIEQNKVKLKKTIRVHKQGGDKEHQKGQKKKLEKEVLKSFVNT